MIPPNLTTVTPRGNAARERGGESAESAAQIAPRRATGAVPRTLSGGSHAMSTSWTHNPDDDRTTVPPYSNCQRPNDIRAATLARAVRARRAPTASLVALQEWEGYVVHIGERDFTALLTDLTAGASSGDEEATIPLAEIAEDDAGRMRLGSVFRLVIGYERSPSGTKKRVSQIVFRDLPAVTHADRREGRKWAREALRLFGS